MDSINANNTVLLVLRTTRT